jgi:hypothetical protein
MRAIISFDDMVQHFLVGFERLGVIASFDFRSFGFGKVFETKFDFSIIKSFLNKKVRS